MSEVPKAQRDARAGARRTTPGVLSVTRSPRRRARCARTSSRRPTPASGIACGRCPRRPTRCARRMRGHSRPGLPGARSKGLSARTPRTYCAPGPGDVARRSCGIALTPRSSASTRPAQATAWPISSPPYAAVAEAAGALADALEARARIARALTEPTRATRHPLGDLTPRCSTNRMVRTTARTVHRSGEDLSRAVYTRRSTRAGIIPTDRVPGVSPDPIPAEGFCADAHLFSAVEELERHGGSPGLHRRRLQPLDRDAGREPPPRCGRGVPRPDRLSRR